MPKLEIERGAARSEKRYFNREQIIQHLGEFIGGLIKEKDIKFSFDEVKMGHIIALPKERAEEAKKKRSQLIEEGLSELDDMIWRKEVDSNYLAGVDAKTQLVVEALEKAIEKTRGA